MNNQEIADVWLEIAEEVDVTIDNIISNWLCCKSQVSNSPQMMKQLQLFYLESHRAVWWVNSTEGTRKANEQRIYACLFLKAMNELGDFDDD